MIRPLVHSRLVMGMLLVLFSTAWPAAAGSINLTWQASAGATGYKIHYGTSPGQYTSSLDVGNVTQTTLTGLNDCAMLYFAASAYNAAGESGLSNVVSSWARSVLSAANPPSSQQGTQIDVTVTGTNFQTGSSLGTSNPNVVVNSVNVSSCSQLTANITVQPQAATGATDLTLTNPAGVAGTGTGLFTVLQGSSDPPPEVQNLRRTDVK